MMGIPVLDPEIWKDSKQQLSFNWEHGSVQGQSTLHTMHAKHKDQGALPQPTQNIRTGVHASQLTQNTRTRVHSP